MQQKVASNLRVFALTIALAMVACVMSLFNPNTASAQVAPAVTQSQACDPWSQPLQVSVPARTRVSIGRIVEITAEDLANLQVAATLAPATFSYPRLATRERTSSGVSTVTALVAAIYAGSDQAVKAGLIDNVTALVRSLGANRISIEESWLWCPATDATGAIILDPLSGRPQHISPTSGVCPDGSAPRQGSRSRMLTTSFSGDFYAGSTVPWVNGRAPVDYRAWRGHSLRVSVKGGPAFSINRVYTDASHPRPGAQLCRRLPELVHEATTATTSAAKQAVLDEQGQLITAAIAEGDLPTAMWATGFAASAVNPAVANLAATRQCESQRTTLLSQLVGAAVMIDILQGRLAAAQGQGDFWLSASALGYALFIIAIIAIIILVVRFRQRVFALTKAWETKVVTAVTEAKKEFWNGLERDLSELVNAVKGYLPKGGDSLTWAQSFEGVPSVAAATYADPSGFLVRARQAVADAMANKTPVAPRGERAPSAPAFTPICYTACDGVKHPIKGQSDFDRVADLIAAAAFEQGANSFVIPSVPVCAAILAHCDSTTGTSSSPCPSRELLSYVTISGLAAELEGAEKDLYSLLNHLAKNGVIDAQLAQEPFVDTAPAIGYQIERFATQSALDREQLSHALEAVTGLQAAESSAIFFRGLAEAVWPIVFGYSLPEVHKPTSIEIATIQRSILGRRVETGPTVAIVQEGSGMVLGSPAITNDPSECMQIVGRQPTVQAQVPDALRRASMPRLFNTQMVAAAAANPDLPTAVYFASPPSDALPTAEAPADPSDSVVAHIKPPTERHRAARRNLKPNLTLEADPMVAPAEPVTPADVQRHRATPLSTPTQAATPTTSDRSSFVGSPLVTGLRAPTPSGVHNVYPPAESVDCSTSTPSAASDSTG